MKIMLTGEESLRIEPTAGMLTIEAESANQSYSPFHMLASAIGMCTFSVLYSWASNKNVSADDLRIDVSWTFAEGQHRVERMSIKLEWPSLSAELWPRALRAAHLCGIHQTLTKPPQITVDALGVDSSVIAAPIDRDARRKPERSAAPIPQADGEPQPSNRT
jgi:uncharacterized OsmC-like protein